MRLSREELAQLDPVQANVLVVIQAILDYQTPPGAPKQTLEPGLAIEALVVVAAALAEATQDKGMDELVERLAGKLVGYAKAFRKEHRESGENALKQLGAELVQRVSIN